jgi:hypothetical protein
MPTPMELRSQAKACLELANRTEEQYAKSALKELARDLNRRAHQIERRERDRATAASRGLRMAWR